MGRNKVKNEVLPVELQVAITAEFPKLMRFNEQSGLNMDRHTFYSILRGEENEPEEVTKVELAWLNYTALRDKSNKELVRTLQKHIRQQVFDQDESLRPQLIAFVSRFLYS